MKCIKCGSEMRYARPMGVGVIEYCNKCQRRATSEDVAGEMNELWPDAVTKELEGHDVKEGAEMLAEAHHKIKDK